jgi:hypothetical protein
MSQAPPPLTAVAVEISSPRKPLGGVKSAEGDCEKHGANFCPLTSKITPSEQTEQICVRNMFRR